jgi:hypothetical protein
MLYLSRDFNGERPGKHAGHVSATGVLPALFKIAMSAVAWFAAVVWLRRSMAAVARAQKDKPPMGHKTLAERSRSRVPPPACETLAGRYNARGRGSLALAASGAAFD